MALVSTVRLKRKSDGREATVNQIDYAMDIGKWADWKRVGETHVEGEVAVARTERTPEPEADPTEPGPDPEPAPASTTARSGRKKAASRT